MKILFFIDSLTSGGKERRMLELIQFLKQHTDYTISLVLTKNLIHFDYVHELGIPIIIIERKIFKYDPLLFIKFLRFCFKFKPDIIHAWGKMTTFYSIPAKLIFRVPLISSLIADAQRSYGIFSFNYLFFSSNVFFSNVILSNSNAGLTTYNIKSPKAKVIYNGVNLTRFHNNYDLKKVREEFQITTNFIVAMIATFSKLKDYDLFLDVAKKLGEIRNDVTMIAVGNGPEWDRIQKRIIDEEIQNVLLTGKQNNVERIIATSDIGLLCTYSEGISNSIIECMALGKPVISTDIIGGSKEIIIEGETGFCTERDTDQVVANINLLLNNTEMRISMGNKGKERIHSHFSIKRMGQEFEVLYKEVLAQLKRKK